MPEALPLMDFKDDLPKLFAQLYRKMPEIFTDETSKRGETFVKRLARSFECDPSVKRKPAVKDATLNGTIRTIRHMIYNHEIIKDHLPSEGKKILIPYRARLQILLAKRLSGLRIIREQREHVLSQDDANLEEILVLKDAEIKIRLTEGVGQVSRKSNGKKSPEAVPLWERQGHPVYRLALTQGLVLEVDGQNPPSLNKTNSKAALGKFLEVTFLLERGSQASNDLIAQIIKAAPNFK